MNAVVQHTGGGSLVPSNMNDAIRLAEMMAKAKTLPAHFHNNPGDTLMVVEQAMRWGMSPFAVAQCTSVVKGRLMHEGKLVAAAVQHSGAIEGNFDYEFSGEGASRAVRVIARRKGDDGPRDITLTLKDAKTENGMWVKQPDQQLVYAGTRVWARRWTPGVLLGVYAPEEFDGGAQPAFTGTTIDAEAVEVDTSTAQLPEPAQAPRKQTVAEFLDALQSDFDAAIIAGSHAVAELLGSETVRKARTLTNGGKARFDAMAKDALDRTADDDGFPGDTTQAAA